MNDFSELECELRKLRPAQPSPLLFERVGEALNECSRASVSDARWSWRRFTEWSRRGGSDIASQLVRGKERERTNERRSTWLSFGFGFAAAATLVVLAVVTTEQRPEQPQTVAQSSPSSETQTQPAPPGTERSKSDDRFVPAGGMNVVYNARNEGLHFADSLDRPVRRVHYHTQQTWRWRNPETGASLRVSYPSEEIVLIPISGQ
jgi:hypothetical protein